MKPVSQIYALIVHQLDGYPHDESYLYRLYISYLGKHGEKKAQEKLTAKKNEIAADLIFQNIIREVNNRRSKIQSIDTWCQKKSISSKIKKKVTKVAVDHHKAHLEVEKQGSMKPLTNWFKKT